MKNEYHNQFPAEVLDEARERHVLIPGLPDLFRWVVTFFSLWAVYILVVRGSNYLEGMKEEEQKTITDVHEAQKKAAKKLAETLSTTLPSSGSSGRGLDLSGVDDFIKKLSRSIMGDDQPERGPNRF